ncbi:putative alcohol dehydrogenase [Lipomyces kononenkoae]|uniref:Alcohol dehydrogenase n=1 Tax=Lipomyces kononenkoae TaxID=34357 RepID=A0ACC3SW51_LIPKO
MPSNTAAWITAKQAKPLVVKSAPYTPPRENEIVVKNGAVAINPVDWMLQVVGKYLFTWIKYPFILGGDLAGEVVEVGSGMSNFKVGDRVLGLAVGADPDRNNSAEAAFQLYSVVLTNMASHIPRNLSYEQAAVLPLTLATAASGLFQKDFLALQFPTFPPQAPTGKTLLVWGGSTSVGSNAIQLAVAAGYEVFTTASPKNFDYVKKLGASRAFDYKKKSVVQEVINAAKGKTMAGALAIGDGSLASCLDIMYHCKGEKFVANISGPGGLPKGGINMLNLVPLMIGMMYWNASTWIQSKRTGVRHKFVWGSGLRHNEVGDAIFGDFLPKALEAQKYICAPEPQVVGKGLEHIQAGFELLKEGVSAKKVVVLL